MDDPAARRGQPSRAFRAGLREELPRWREEGLLDERAARTLTERYALDEKGFDLASAAVYGLGALLVGGGVLSFVAWNWEHLPDAAKLALGGAVMTAAHLGGWHLWKVRGTWPRCGEGLVLLGTLLFGANIGLVAQTWHISSTWYGGFGAWALGAAVAAWLTGSAVQGVLGASLAFLWSCGYVGQHEGGWPFFPALVAVLFLPLAWRLRSRWLFAVTVLATSAAVADAAGEETNEAVAVIAALLACAAPLVAWPLAFRGESPGARFAPIARALGFAVFAVLAYAASFREIAGELAFHELEGESFRWTAAAIPAVLASVVFVTLGGMRAADVLAEARARAPTLAALAGVAFLLLGMTARDDGLLLAVAANVALGLTAAAAVASSVRDLERGPFWWGTVTLALLIVTRFLEYDTNLGVKALVFAASGVGVILVGVLFERRRRARGTHDAA